MKRIFLLMLIFLIALTSAGQSKLKIIYGDTLNKTDVKNLKQGIWQDTLSNMVSRGNYLNGKKDGEWVTYNYKGLINKIESYKNGIKYGVFVSFDDSGNLKSEENYKNGILNGLQRTYASGGRLLSSATYINGVMEGSKQTFYEMNSKIQEDGYYKNGVRDSITKWYDSEGKIMAEYSYKNGKFDGTNKIFYKSGNVETEEHYLNSIENGAHKEYYDTTLVKKPVNPDLKTKKADNVNNEIGKIKIIGNYINGKKDGKWIEYDQKGNIIKSAVYKNGIEK